MEDAIAGTARRSPFDASEIGLRVAITNGPKINATHVRIRIDLADLMLQPRDNRYRGELSVTLAAYAEGFATGAASKFDVDMNFTEDQFQRALKDGLVVSQDMRIPNQVQRIRVVVYDRGLHAVGSVTVPVTSH